MAKQETIDELKGRLTEYVNSITKPDRKAGKNKYICPFSDCQSGGHGRRDSDGAFTIADSGTSWKCFACDRGGDIFDLIGYMENLDNFPDKLKRAGEIFGVDTENDSAGRAGTAENKNGDKIPAENIKAVKTQNTASEGHNKNFNDYYDRCRDHITDVAALDYLSYRGLNMQTAAAYGLGYDPESAALIIPCSKYFYIARNTDKNAQRRYNNPAGVQVELFNKDVVYNNDGRPVFICEGAFDALAIIDAGGQAVGLNSTSNYRKLLDMLKDKKTENVLIICLDNDEQGRKAADELINGLKSMNISCIENNIAGSYKDPNEAYTANPDTFKDNIAAAERTAKRPDNIADYIKNIMPAEITKMQADSGRKTGFSNLDAEINSLYSGLYVIGAISSLGKTTFAHQLGDNLATAGDSVLYFSMEQSRLEMVSKSIARQTAIIDPHNGRTSIQIRTGYRDEITDKATAQYLAAVGDRLNIIECNYGYNAPLIEQYTRDYIRQNDVRPVVIVDYLQVMTAAVDPDTGRKPTDVRAITDANITALKRMSRDLEISVIVISSVNRSNYLTPIDFESFKESGSIEFTSDVVWGLQLDAIHEELFTENNKITKKRERIAQAKAENPRKIELVCLKNRYGKSSYSCHYKYYPQYDYFEPYDPYDFKPVTKEDLAIFEEKAKEADKKHKERNEK